MKFNIEFFAEAGNCWPEISVSINDVHVKNFVINQKCCVIEFYSDLNSVKNTLELYYFNKTQDETIISTTGEITKDQSLRLNRIWVDDVLMQTWFLTDGQYVPEYFDGFLSQFPNSPKILKSQLNWHFPGKYNINFSNPFWPWYSNNRKHHSKKINVDKDQERWENYSGSFNSHQDLVNEIYNLINVPKNSNSNVS
jgi:hypothetical protein